MDTIQLHDKKFELYIKRSEIENAIKAVGMQINNDLKNEDTPIFLSILNGSFMFTSDLMKEINFNCEVTFVKFSSYSGTESTGCVGSLIGLNTDITGRAVVIVEDIVDRGITLECIVQTLKQHNPKSVKIATLLYKPDSYEKDIVIDYVGLKIPNDFIVGYGLDYNELGRNYNDIYKLKQ